MASSLDASPGAAAGENVWKTVREFIPHLDDQTSSRHDVAHCVHVALQNLQKAVSWLAIFPPSSCHASSTSANVASVLTLPYDGVDDAGSVYACRWCACVPGFEQFWVL
eukprot:4545845-Amphidinium_carterae.1